MPTVPRSLMLPPHQLVVVVVVPVIETVDVTSPTRPLAIPNAAISESSNPRTVAVENISEVEVLVRRRNSNVSTLAYNPCSNDVYNA
jgi:hypothetical protein